MSMNINAKQAELLKNYYLEGNTKGTSAKEIRDIEAKYGKENIKTFIVNCQKNASVDNNEYQFEIDDGSNETQRQEQLSEMRAKRNWKWGGAAVGVAAVAVAACLLSGPVGWAVGIIGGIAALAFGGMAISDNKNIAEAEEAFNQERANETAAAHQGGIQGGGSVNITDEDNINQTVNINVDFGNMEDILQQILDKVTNIDVNVGDIKADLSQIEAMLDAIGGKLDQLNDTQLAMYNMLQANFNSLSREIQRGNGLAAEILAATIKYGNDNNEANQQIIDLLGKINDAMYNMDVQQRNNFNLILQGLRGLSAQDYSAQLQAIYDKLCDINGNITEQGAAILAKMDETIDAVDRNGEMMNTTLNEILNKIRAGNVTFDEISAYLQAIQNNTGDSAADLALIRTLLEQILAAEIDMSDGLNEFHEKIDGQYAQILQDIYDRIPELLNTGNTTNINVEVNMLVVYLIEIFSDIENGQRANEGEAHNEFNWIFNRDENPDMPQGGALARYNELLASGMTEQEAIRALLQELFGGGQNQGDE